MRAHFERLSAGPDRLDNLQSGILPVGVNSNQTAAGPQRPRQRRDDAFGAEIDRGFGPVGLRSNDQVEIGLGAAGARDDRIEQKTVRSEEHTSELQSHLNLVCRLLLEKK